jgi:hypothetical protein
MMTAAIPHPNGKTARIIALPQTPSMPALTGDEELMIAQNAEIAALRKDAEAERDSRGMFVARLRKLQDNGKNVLTIAHVLSLLNDCDMLAARGDGDAAMAQPAKGE